MDPRPYSLREKSEEKTGIIELIEAFKRNNLPLNSELEEMLLEKPIHQTPRRGSGFTQASRFLANLVRLPRSDNDMQLFRGSVSDDILNNIFKNGGYDRLDTTSVRLQVDKEKLKAIEGEMTKPATQLLAKMIGDLFGVHPTKSTLQKLPSSKGKLEIGTCTSAEVYFYDFLQDDSFQYNENYEQKVARMNIVIDNLGEPIFIEKIGLGENHSAISLKPFYFNEVEIPQGSLVALQYDPNKKGEETRSGRGNIVKSSDLDTVEFLRFTPLVVEPVRRKEVFGTHLDMQINNGMYKPDTLKIEDFITKAKLEISGKK